MINAGGNWTKHWIVVTPVHSNQVLSQPLVYSQHKQWTQEKLNSKRKSMYVKMSPCHTATPTCTCTCTWPSSVLHSLWNHVFKEDWSPGVHTIHTCIARSSRQVHTQHHTQGVLKARVLQKTKIIKKKKKQRKTAKRIWTGKGESKTTVHMYCAKITRALLCTRTHAHTHARTHTHTRTHTQI